jgi:hypothetical protein
MKHVATTETTQPLTDRLQAARDARTLEGMAKTESGERKAALLRAAHELRTGCAA